MEKSIIVAVVSVSIMVVARIIMGLLALSSGEVSPIRIIIPIALAVLILVGIIKGHRLAWQWGRMLGLLGGIILTLAAVGVFANAAEHPELILFGGLLALQGVPLFPMFFALGSDGAKEHFRVICPNCGKSKVKSGDFLFTKAVCRECNTAWQ
jgi:hypothetical protein